MKKIVEMKNVTKFYGKTLGIENLNLELKSGEIFGFIGPNGAGKSTTIRIIMNLIDKTAGEIILFDEPLQKNNMEIKKKIGYLPSEIHLYDDFTVKEMLDYHEMFYQVKTIHKRRKELVKLLKLDEKKRIEDLSLGNLKKVGIVLAMMHQPQLLILDEPTSGLDPIMQNKFYELLLKEKEKGTTIFYSSHILSEVSKICDRVGIIKDGHLLKIESIKELDDKKLTHITIVSKDIDKIEKALKIEPFFKDGSTIKFKNTISADTVIKTLSKYSVEKILIEEAPLEDIFLHYYE